MQMPTIPGAIAHPESHEPIRFLARLGYAVKGVVYGVMGVLALRVGLGDGGRLAGEHEAVREVHRHPFGDVALVVIGAGLACYAIWRLIEAAFDPYRVGRSLRGVAARVTSLASAIANGAVALMAFELAAGEAESGTNPKILAVSVLREDWGPALLSAIGAGIAGVGIFTCTPRSRTGFASISSFAVVRAACEVTFFGAAGSGFWRAAFSLRSSASPRFARAFDSTRAK